jgi:cathepsin C
MLVFALLVAACHSGVRADTPANCTYEELRGQWTFYVGEGGHTNKIDCSKMGPVSYKYHLTLDFPDVVKDEFGNKGFWTLIYNQGFEVVIHGRKFFAFSKYTGTMENSTSYCDQTFPGWTHDVAGRDWACYYGTKKARALLAKTSSSVDEVKGLAFPKDPQRLFIHDYEMVYQINKQQSMWTAGHYPEYETMTLEDLVNRAGGAKSRIPDIPKPALASDEVKKSVADLPASFDWRNIKGINYVSPVRNQGNCGSCYAFSAAGMNEARLRVATNNTVQLVFSPQDVVDCSPYSQGCDGGFPYLIGGKYSEDFGMVEESCNPYVGTGTGSCGTKPSCARHYVTRYEYIGGYYGACNEEQMMLALVNHGPLSVSFQVYSDFQQYKGGIYHHTGVKSRFNPFQLTNHAVLLVGYGVDHDSGVKFWTIKNSWGDSWGEQGYFRIRRGTDECAVESIAVQAFPVF